MRCLALALLLLAAGPAAAIDCAALSTGGLPFELTYRQIRTADVPAPGDRSDVEMIVRGRRDADGTVHLVTSSKTTTTASDYRHGLPLRIEVLRSSGAPIVSEFVYAAGALPDAFLHEGKSRHFFHQVLSDGRLFAGFTDVTFERRDRLVVGPCDLPVRVYQITRTFAAPPPSGQPYRQPTTIWFADAVGTSVRTISQERRADGQVLDVTFTATDLTSPTAPLPPR